jgi:hypothetical protein
MESVLLFLNYESVHEFPTTEITNRNENIIIGERHQKCRTDRINWSDT